MKHINDSDSHYILQIKVFGEKYEELYDIVPRHILPEEFGGEGGKIMDIRSKYCI